MYRLLTVGFPFSNAEFALPLPAEFSECILEGLKQLFKHAGGIPTHLQSQSEGQDSGLKNQSNLIGLIVPVTAIRCLQN